MEALSSLKRMALTAALHITENNRINSSSASAWSVSPESITLGSDEVHVWRAALNLRLSSVETLRQTLADDEQTRAKRFHFDVDRNHFVVARGLLRVLLGRYLEAEPSKLRFCYSQYGKPALVSEFDAKEEQGLRFNVSHSDGLALYAVTRGREIGIDLERLRPNFANERIAEQFFSPGEVAVLRRLPANMQQAAFFNCWTRKEAYIKARGEGLSHPLDQFDVSLIPGEPATLLSTRGDPEEVDRWSLQELAPQRGYVASIAVEGRSWRLKCWEWPEGFDAASQVERDEPL